jgi:Tol biopolymer transport system component
LGDEVAFTSARAEGVQIVVANVHTGRLRPYPQARVSEGSWSLSWSPGTRIAYQRAGNSAIHLLDPESGFDHALIIDSGGFFHAPAFSPDGRELAITWNRGGGDQSIWLLDLTDSARRRIQDSARTGTTTGGPYAIGWSPDGRYVLATLGRSIIRFHTRIAGPPDTIATRPIAGGQCTPGGRLLPTAFICAASDLKSDVWKIDHFAAPPP